MANYLMVATSIAKDGRDDEYNEWYDTQHIHDVSAAPGMGAGQRWDAMPEASPNQPPAPYLAIYDIEADDPGGAVKEVMRRVETGEMPMTDSIDIAKAQIWVYKKH